MSRLGALVRDAARLDRTQSDPVVAARNALGVAAPLVIGALFGGASYGLPATIGALQTAFADRPGPYRLRVLRMGVTALAAATTSALAVAFSTHDAASVLLLLVVAFIAGLLVSGGPSATQVGIASTAAALVLGHQARQPGIALHIGLLVLAGGLGQTVLAISGWPLRRHLPERRALADLYRALAALALRPSPTTTGPPLGELLASVRGTLYGLGHDHGPSVEAYRVLLDEAERIRREVLVCGSYAERLTRAGARSDAAAIRTVLHGAATVLDAVAQALLTGQPVTSAVLVDVRDQVDAALSALAPTTSSLQPGDARGLTRRAALARLRALTGQLRAIVDATRAGASEGGAQQHEPFGQRVRDPLAVLRANLSPRSTVFQHAVRTSVLVAGSDLVLRLAHVNRGYWVALTLLVVLRPDFATTFQRACMRVAGTVLGLLVMTGLVHWIPGGEWYAIALIALLFFGMRLAGPGNLLLGAACLSGLVVVLLSMVGISPHTTVLTRGLDTAIGGALAVAAILVRPTWERDAAAARLAELLVAYSDYTDVVADLTFDPPRLQRARSAARLARTNAEASVDRVAAEPVPARGQVELGRAVLSHTHRYVHAVLALEALRPALRRNGMAPPLAALLQLASDALRGCATALRTGAAPAQPPGLRDLQAQLAATPELLGGDDGAALVDAGDRLVNSLDTLIAELRRLMSVR